MEKYGNIADFFIATLDDEDLRNKLLSCKTIDKMYDFVSTLCSEKFSKEKFEIFISKMIKNHLVDKRIPNNRLQEVSGGRFQEMSGRNGKMEEIFKKTKDKAWGFLNRHSNNFFTLESNTGSEKNPVSKLRACSMLAHYSSPLIESSYGLSKGLFILYSNLKKNMGDDELEMLKDELYDLNDEIQELEKNKK